MTLKIVIVQKKIPTLSWLVFMLYPYTYSYSNPLEHFAILHEHFVAYAYDYYSRQITIYDIRLWLG